MTLENEKRFLLLMSSFIVGNEATKAKVLDTIENEKWANFSESDLKLKHNRNELVWRNDYAFVRKHLEINSYFTTGVRNDWSITYLGKKELKSLCKKVLNENHFNIITDKAIKVAKDIYEIMGKTHSATD